MAGVTKGKGKGEFARVRACGARHPKSPPPLPFFNAGHTGYPGRCFWMSRQNTAERETGDSNLVWSTVKDGHTLKIFV